MYTNQEIFEPFNGEGEPTDEYYEGLANILKRNTFMSQLSNMTPKLTASETALQITKRRKQ